MKKINVYLQYPWKFPDSPYYKYLLDHPPEYIKYFNEKAKQGPITNRNKFWLLTRLKVNIRKWTNRLNLPLTNAWKTKQRKSYDLIHCAHCLSKNKNKPWVADMESVWSMWVSGMNTKIGKEKVRKILSDDNCKKIMPWTENTKKEIVNIFPEIKGKLEVLYPAVPVRDNKNKRKGRFTILFIGRDYRLKGGKIALGVFKRLKEIDPSIRTIFVSRYPEGLEEDYPGVEFHNILPQKDIYTLLSGANLFLYPSLMDTFGFSILEAMSFGVPTIALETKLTKSVKEIITENKTGKIIKTGCNINSQEGSELETTTKKLIETIRVLMRKEGKLKGMRIECLKQIKDGKFSIKQRNKRLRKIYEGALR
jgi:glycosyltransferase involved in cell wall biosynthesis